LRLENFVLLFIQKASRNIVRFDNTLISCRLLALETSVLSGDNGVIWVWTRSVFIYVLNPSY